MAKGKPAPSKFERSNVMRKWNPIIILAIAFVLAIISFAGCKSKVAEITAFKIGDRAGTITQTVAGGTVDFKVLYGTDLSEMEATVTVSPKATVEPASGALLGFSKPVTYTVTAENGKVKKNYTVTVTTLPNTEAEIKSFDFPGLEKWSPQPDGNTVIINAVAKYGTDIKNLVPVIKISDGATIDLASGVKQDFSKPVPYKVTAQDGKASKEYTVKVTVAEPAKKVKLTTIVLGGVSADIDTTKHTVRVEVADKISLDSVALSKLEGSFGKIEPGLKPGDKLDFSKGAKMFVFSPEDSTVKATEKWSFIAYHPASIPDSAKLVIGKGEGVEHALIRQLLANPYAWGYAGSSLKNRAAVRKWAGSEAHRLAIRTGYVDYATGKEIRVKTGAVYLLWTDGGEVSVSEYASMKDYQAHNTKPAETNVAAASLKEAKFATVVQSYEYVFNPVSHAELQAAKAEAAAKAAADAKTKAEAAAKAAADAKTKAGGDQDKDQDKDVVPVPIPFNALPPFPVFNIQE